MGPNNRKCAKCGLTRAKDMSVTYHRFPDPGTTNIINATCQTSWPRGSASGPRDHAELGNQTTARAWAKYCWPNEDWTSVESLDSLRRKNKVLCGRHFNSNQFYDNKKQKLSKFAVPDSIEVQELLNERENIVSDVSDLKTASNLSALMTSVTNPESHSVEMRPDSQSVLKPVNEEPADSIKKFMTSNDNIISAPNIFDDLNVAGIELTVTSETSDTEIHASGINSVTSPIDQIYNIFVLYDGYSYINESNNLNANCTCTLIKGPKNIIIDTMTSWDTEKIINGLKNHGLSPHEIEYVVSTHGHSDHIGNNNLFLKARHIVGFSISHKDTYFPHPFDKGIEYIIDDNIKVIPTPGHTLSDVTVLLNTGVETVAVVGDLFENAKDIFYPNIWLDAGSEDPEQQQVNRLKVAELADWIVPGHGPKFRVTDDIKHVLRHTANIKNENDS